MKRILFVDDEQNVLDGLQRMLRRLRHEWDMTFVSNGHTALKEMETSHFDAIVTDMRMPGMDGPTLLARVKEDHPSTVRIVLSGQAGLQATMRALPVAHQFLSKPCRSQLIRSVVTRACDLRAMLEDPSLLKLVGSIDTLPALPRVYNELTSALADPEVCLDDVATIVQQDVGISAKILQLVNSSFFGVTRPIEGIRQATIHLGTSMLSSLVLCLDVFRAFDDKQPAGGFSIEKTQAHATLCARIARHLIGDKQQSEQAFMAATLHDVGKLVLGTTLREDFGRVLAAHQTSDRAFSELEKDTMGASHAELGAYLLGIWGMPTPVVEAVAHHHHPARVEQREFGLLGSVHVADVLAHEVAGSPASSGDAAPHRIDMDYLDAMGVVDELPAWREMAAREAQGGEQAAA